MLSSLLVLLAPMGLENCTLKRNTPLFSDPRLSINPTVRIVEGNWDEARLVPHVAGILLREMFGLSVEYVRDGENSKGTNSSRMYDMLADDEADLALTLWPAKFLKTDRLAALSASCPKSLSERCVATVGNQGYKARSGWFVTAGVSAVRGKEAEWSTVVSLYDQNHTESLTKAYDIPPVNLCDSIPDALTYGGKFDCADGSWMHDEATCCSRSDYDDNLCGAKKPCVALMVDKPSYDAGLNEGIVGRLAQKIRVSNQDDRAVGIQIVYGDVLEEIKKAEASNRPLLFYSWLPRPEVMTPNRFVRITLESFYHCGKGDLEKDASDLAEPSFLAKPLLRGVAACDFPVEQVEKAAVWRLQQPSATNAKLFVGKFTLNSTQLQELLDLENELSGGTPDEIACTWLNRNTDAWEAWLPGSHLYDATLFQWEGWLICCGVCFIVVLGCAAIRCAIREAMKMKMPLGCAAIREATKQKIILGCTAIREAMKMKKTSAKTDAVENHEDVKPMDVVEQAETLAKDLASDCYMSAVKAFSSLLGVVFATGFLFYYTFKEGVPRARDISPLTFTAFFLGPIFGLMFGLGGLLRRNKCQHSGVPTADKVRSYKVAFAGVMWFSTYLLWALAPIFMTPLISDYGPGTNSALQSDVLTVLLVLHTMGSSLIEAEECFTKMLRSSDKAKRVIACLNVMNEHKSRLNEAGTVASEADGQSTPHRRTSRRNSIPRSFSWSTSRSSPSKKDIIKDAQQTMESVKRLNSPLKTYLTMARGYLFKPGGDYPRATRSGLVFFAFGQLFVAASSGFFKILLFETWLGDGLNKLSLEVTISCAVLMLTLALIDWSVELLPSGEKIVRRKLRDELEDVGKLLMIQPGQRPGSPKTHSSRTVSDESVEAEAKANEIKKAETDANEIKKKAETDANEIKKKAEADANEIKEKAETDANEIKKKAETDANEIKKKAEADANEIKEKAETDANEIKKKAEADANEIKEKAETDAKAKADGIKEKAEADAKAKADGIKEKAEADAKAKADQIIAGAKANADQIIADSKQELKEAKKKLEATNEELKEYKEAFDCKMQ